MGLRAEYSLGHSEYNDFLFAVVGEEASGQPLTVLSALARLGLDPWGEAARLSGLGRMAARTALAALIRTLPEGDWTESETYSIAVRLVDLLPGYASGPPEQAPGGENEAARGSKSETRQWLFWIALAAVAFVVLSRLYGSQGLGL